MPFIILALTFGMHCAVLVFEHNGEEENGFDPIRGLVEQQLMPACLFLLCEQIYLISKIKQGL